MFTPVFFKMRFCLHSCWLPRNLFTCFIYKSSVYLAGGNGNWSFVYTQTWSINIVSCMELVYIFTMWDSTPRVFQQLMAQFVLIVRWFLWTNYFCAGISAITKTLRCSKTGYYYDPVCETVYILTSAQLKVR